MQRDTGKTVHIIIDRLLNSFMISGFSRGVNEILDLMGFYAAHISC
jgi:hypothetical protein